MLCVKVWTPGGVVKQTSLCINVSKGTIQKRGGTQILPRGRGTQMLPIFGGVAIKFYQIFVVAILIIKIK